MRKRNEAGPNIVKLLLTMDEAAQTLSMGRYSLYRLLHSKKIQYITEGKRKLIVVSSLYAYIDNQVNGVSQ